MDAPKSKTSSPSTKLPGRVIGGGSLLYCIGLLSIFKAGIPE
jgi:hypothetical protein